MSQWPLLHHKLFAISAAVQAAVDTCRGCPGGPKARLTAPSSLEDQPVRSVSIAVKPDVIIVPSAQAERWPAVMAVAASLRDLRPGVFGTPSFKPPARRIRRLHVNGDGCNPATDLWCISA
jgi:hypothetical protein